MKKIYLLAACICSSWLVASAQDDATVSFMGYQSIQDSLMQHLDKGKISTGVLYDRVNPIARFTQLKDKEAANVITDFSHARQAWDELYRAAYDKDNLLPLEYAESIITQNRQERNALSLGYIAFDFNSIDPAAFNAGTIHRGADSLLYDGDGNPYLTNRVNLPLLSTNGVSGSELKLYLDPRLQLNNSVRQLSYMELQAGDKQPITIAPGELATLDISGITNSTIRLGIKLHWVGLTLVESFDILLENGNLIPLSSTTTDLCNSGPNPIGISSGPGLVFRGYTESTPVQGFGEYKVFYRKPAGGWVACNDAHRVIRKPIIIIDGFDPGDDRRITSYDQSGKKVDGIWDLFSYGTNKHLGDDFRSKGHDVIVLNFPKHQIGSVSVTIFGNTYTIPIYRDGGADYIERNAMVLTRLIQKVNADLQAVGSTEKIVVVGPSMGGQIARYALKYMENNNLNHNTRLFVSFDSPNHGANIPVGLQSAILYAAYVQESVDARKQYEQSIRSTAAKQMLIHQVTNQSLTQNGWTYHYPIATQNDFFRQTWQSTIDNMGYPTQLRKVALVNGSRNMAWQPSVTTLIDYEITKAGGGVPPQGTRLAKLQVYSTAHNFSSKVFYGHILTKPAMNIYHNITNGWGNLDGASGGLFDVSRLLTKEMTLGKHRVDRNKVWFINLDLNGMGVLHANAGDYNTFIPTVSALGYNNRNFEWGQNLGTNNLVCSNQIPFDNYYTPSSNQPHITVTEASAQWISQEIDKGQANCPKICKAMLLVNNNLNTPLCIGSTRTFYHNYNLLPGQTVSWDYSNGLLQLMSSNNSSITVKSLNHGAAFVKAIINNPCGANLEEKMIFSSGAGYSFTVSRYDITGPAGKGKVLEVNPNSPAITAISWSIDGTNFTDHNQVFYNVYKIGTAPSRQVWLKTENTCGSYLMSKPVWFDNNDYNDYYTVNATLPNLLSTQVAVYPNPTHSSWTVDIPEAEAARLELYDETGRKVRTVEKAQFKANIGGGELPAGVYLLKVILSGRQTSYKLIKQ